MLYKQIPCPNCDGWGEYWDAHFSAYYPCEQCGGPGWIYDCDTVIKPRNCGKTEIVDGNQK